MTVEEGLLLSGLLIDFEPAQYWNDQSIELKLNYKVDEDFFIGDNAFDFIGQAVGGTISFYPDGYLMEEFAHYNQATNLKFRPKNWAKDHTDDEPRKLGVLGCRELMVNQTLDATTQVQDLSSQYICSKIEVSDDDKVWDVCSGAGGKSLNLSSVARADFHLSDIRPGSIENAKSRFRSMHYDATFGVADLSKAHKELKFGTKTIGHEYFNAIVADVPCSGSGTWFRTPEHFTRFHYDKLENYSAKQKDIVQNSIPFLKKGGKFYYITCSIFSEENTNVRDWILKNFEVSLSEEIIFDGLKQKADGMYLACFVKN